jgi:hypothetical protein
MFVPQVHSKATIFAAVRAASRSAVTVARARADHSANEITARSALTVK